MKRTNARQRGITLVEVIISLAVFSVLSAMAIPALQAMIRTARLTATMSDLTHQFAHARIHAVSLNGIVAVCPSSHGRCESDADWTRGWMVYRDDDRNRQPYAAAHIIQEAGPVHGGLRVASSTSRAQLRYLPDGRSSGTNLTVHLCDGPSLVARVVVNNAGRIRSERLRKPGTCPF